MRRDRRAYLWDARQAGERIQRFVAARSWEDYEADELLSSAVERQFEIIGEALARLSREDPATAQRIPELPRIVAFRNVLIHGYATVDPALVWAVATERLADLLAVVNDLLDQE